jgi:disulfide bond formation protein DsbB
MVQTASFFFALLAIATNAGLLGILALVVAERRGSAAAGVALDSIGAQGLALAWMVALVATLGSLYYSEVAGFPPCPLCWYQRIAMYPLAVILGVATFRRDPDVRRYVWPLTLAGGLIAAYHYQLEWFPTQAGVACDAAAPCTVRWVFEFGFVSLPYMALSAFAFIAALLYAAGRER